MLQYTKIFPWLIPLRIVTIIMLIWALVPTNPYGYYILLRWFSCGVFIYLAIAGYKSKQLGWMLLFIISAGIYNTILRVHLGRTIWVIVNISSICLVSVSFMMKDLSQEKEKTKEKK